MVLRRQYLEKLKKLKDKQVIKVVTGVRRCGKSTLLAQFQELLLESGVEKDRIIALNFEDIANEPLLEYHALYSYITEKLADGKTTYVFLDEIQAVPEFQKAVDSLFIKPNVDLYITGSNAHILSGELATLLSGRYVTIRLLPLSFAEYYELVGGETKGAWNAYFQNGGFPYTAYIGEKDVRREYLSGIYHMVLLKDIVARNRFQDVALLESIVRFLLENIGNMVSSKKIADSLSSYGRKISPITVENYVNALMDSFILYRAGRYDVKGKQYLKSLEKYYVVDVGFRRLLMGDKNSDIGHILENIVFLELIRRGYSVSIGKAGDLEIDFVAEAGEKRCYYQVASSVLDPATYAREIAPLKKISDHYPKYIVTMDEIPMGEDGIRQIHIVDFLLDKQAFHENEKGPSF